MSCLSWFARMAAACAQCLSRTAPPEEPSVAEGLSGAVVTLSMCPSSSCCSPASSPTSIAWNPD